MCRITGTDPPKFRTIPVAKGRVAKCLERGDMEGPCDAPKNCKTLCPEGTGCDTGQCVGTCKPVECLVGQKNECRCKDEDSARRKLTWPSTSSVKMCCITQLTPTKFKTHTVARGRFKEYKRAGELTGSCTLPKNCEKLCPNGSCKDGECAPKIGTQVAKRGPCLGQKYICKCVPDIGDRNNQDDEYYTHDDEYHQQQNDEYIRPGKIAIGKIFLPKSSKHF